MAGRSLTARVSLGSIPRWVALLGIIVGSRAISTALMLWFAAGQAENAWTGARPDIFEFSRMWDSHWYRIIAESGYPNELPMVDGEVGENAWAFMPIFPLLVRGLMVVTGGSFAVVSVSVSVVAFAVFIVLADRLMRGVIGDRAALRAMAVIACAPVSAVYQVGYAESLALMFAAIVLVGIAEKRWALAAIALPLTTLTRPLGAPFVIALAVLVVLRWKSPDRTRLLWLELVAVVSTALWPVIAWVSTGRLTAYLETELAWRRPYLGGDTGHGWGTGWWDSALWWFPESAPWVIGAIAATVLVIAFLPATRRLGAVVVAWVWGYLGYLVLVLFPQSSIFRLLAPMWPLSGVIARSRTASVVAIVLGVVGQYFWIKWCWSVEGADWTPP